MDHELLEFDRVAKIQSINEQYDLENNAYISFSGGKDSMVLHTLIDLALPNNKIPRVYFNTGIEYKFMREFVKELAKKDSRIVIYNSGVNIKQMLETYGYPFKSKPHSHIVAFYQKSKNKELFRSIKAEIENKPELLKDYDYIHNLPRGVKSLVKDYYGIRERERERDLYFYQGMP